MPHFAKVVKPSRRPEVLILVRATLQANLVAKGLVHMDVAWRNVGLYSAMGGEECAVLFDRGRVKNATTGDEDWVERAMTKLEQPL